MTTHRSIVQFVERRANQRPTTPQPTPHLAPRRDYRERDFGIGYGRSSGYACERQYASQWIGAVRFRCG